MYLASSATLVSHTSVIRMFGLVLAFCACSAAEEGDKEGKEEKEEKEKSDSKSDKSEDKEDGVRVLFCWSKTAGTWNGTEVEERLKQLCANLFW